MGNELYSEDNDTVTYIWRNTVDEDKKLIENIKGLDNGMLVYDTKERPVILVNNEWSLNWILDRNPGIQFLTVPADVEKI